MGGLLAFRVGNFDNTAEREQFRFLCERLKSHYENSNEFCVFVGNYSIGCELDALFIKKDAIIAIEFKNYGGHVIANENGEWQCDGKTIKGGSRKTVLQQARINHSLLKRELKALGIAKNNIKDIPTLIIFNQPIDLENNLGFTTKMWLHITDNDHFIHKLDDLTCPHTELPPLEIINLAELLKLNNYYLEEFSNAKYVSPSSKEKTFEISSKATECEILPNSIAPEPKSTYLIKNKNIHGKDALVATETYETMPYDLEEDLKNYQEFAKQIIKAVCKKNVDKIQVLDKNTFLSLWPNFSAYINNTIVIVTYGSFTREEISHLHRFLQKDVIRLDDNTICWGTGNGNNIIPNNLTESINKIDKDENKQIEPTDSITLDNIFPDWLDDFIFIENGAKYKPDYIRFEYNLDLTKEEVLTYLGTYFPRSYMEIRTIMSHLLSATSFNDILSTKESLSILDLGCGTGGEIIGLLLFLEHSFPQIKSISILAIDGNHYALRIFEKVLKYVRKKCSFHIDYIVGPAFISNEEDLKEITEVFSNKFDFILSFKAICEFITKKRLSSNAYMHFSKILAPHLTDDGILVIEDVTVKSPDKGQFLPEIMNSGINEFIRENDSYVTVLPKQCRLYGDRCKTGCFFKNSINLSHSHKKNDVSKIAYRIISRRKLLDRLTFNVQFNDIETINCKIK